VGEPIERGGTMGQEEHPNVRLAREGFDAMNTGDMSWIDAHLADDAVWHVGGKSKMAGDYQGKHAIMDLFARQLPLMGQNPRIDLHDVVGNDRHVVAIGRASFDDPDGGTVDYLYANVFHFEGDMLTEAWGLADETSGFDALVDKVMG